MAVPYTNNEVRPPVPPRRAIGRSPVKGESRKQLRHFCAARDIGRKSLAGKSRLADRPQRRRTVWE
jgi:hypothetical protein